jgi:hypothetical protein
MSKDRITQLRSLEGRQVGLAVANGSRIDDCQLVSAGRQNVDSVWVFSNGSDVFVPRADLVDLWEVMTCQAA